MELDESLSVRESDDGELRGRCLPGAAGYAFGGSLLAHAVHAAHRRAHEGGRLQSLRMTFHRAAQADRPVGYRVGELMRSRRLTTVEVVATQDGSRIATGLADFHTPEPSAERGITLPPGVWTTPEQSTGDTRHLAAAPDSPIRAPFDVRLARRTGGPPPAEGEVLNGLWIRARSALQGWDGIHEAALAWASDFSLTRNVDGPDFVPDERWFAASLNHSMWFHRRPRLDEWVFAELSSPVRSEGIALSTARFFASDGRLLASVAQECLVRGSSPAP